MSGTGEAGAGAGIRHVPGRRFEMDTNAGTAKLEYRREGETVRLTHTEVPREDEGRGDGGRLVAHALAWARVEGLSVIPTCPFVSSWIRRHPEHLDLVPTEWPGRERLVRGRGEET